MTRPDRCVVLNALGVVPHAIGVDEARTRAARDLEHATVDVVGHAREHLRRRRPETFRPMPPDVTTTAGARSLSSPMTSRALFSPRAALLGARISPPTPSTVPVVTIRDVTR